MLRIATELVRHQLEAQPWRADTSFPPSMLQLDSGLLRLGVDQVDNPPQRFNLFILPEPGILGCILALYQSLSVPR